MSALEEHKWYKTRPSGTKVEIKLLGIEEFIGPTGWGFDVLVFTVKTGVSTGKFLLFLNNDRLELIDECE